MVLSPYLSGLVTTGVQGIKFLLYFGSNSKYSIDNDLAGHLVANTRTTLQIHGHVITSPAVVSLAGNSSKVRCHCISKHIHITCKFIRICYMIGNISEIQHRPVIIFNLVCCIEHEC